jgi:hypothetical protein
MYIPSTFLKNSCRRNHDKYTLCGQHFREKHIGDWKKCKICKNQNSDVDYTNLSTNNFNFEKLNIQKKEIKCANCGFTSNELGNSIEENCFQIKFFFLIISDDFAGSTLSNCLKHEDFFCKKPKCKQLGAFVGGDTVFQHTVRDPFFNEKYQRNIASARLGALSTESVKNADDYALQAEKLLQKV